MSKVVKVRIKELQLSRSMGVLLKLCPNPFELKGVLLKL